MQSRNELLAANQNANVEIRFFETKSFRIVVAVIATAFIIATIICGALSGKDLVSSARRIDAMGIAAIALAFASLLTLCLAVAGFRISSLAKKKKVLTAENCTLVGENEELRLAKDGAEGKNSRLELENAWLSNQKKSLEDDVNHLGNERNYLRRELKLAMEENQKLYKERDRANLNLASVKKENDYAISELNDRLSSSQVHINSLSARITEHEKKATGEVKHIGGDSEKEISRLRNEVVALKNSKEISTHVRGFFNDVDSKERQDLEEHVKKLENNLDDAADKNKELERQLMIFQQHKLGATDGYESKGNNKSVLYIDMSSQTEVDISSLKPEIEEKSFEEKIEEDGIVEIVRVLDDLLAAPEANETYENALVSFDNTDEFSNDHHGSGSLAARLCDIVSKVHFLRGELEASRREVSQNKVATKNYAGEIAFLEARIAELSDKSAAEKEASELVERELEEVGQNRKRGIEEYEKSPLAGAGDDDSGHNLYAAKPLLANSFSSVDYRDELFDENTKLREEIKKLGDKLEKLNARITELKNTEEELTERLKNQVERIRSLNDKCLALEKSNKTAAKNFDNRENELKSEVNEFRISLRTLNHNVREIFNDANKCPKSEGSDQVFQLLTRLCDICNKTCCNATDYSQDYVDGVKHFTSQDCGNSFKILNVSFDDSDDCRRDCVDGGLPSKELSGAVACSVEEKASSRIRHQTT